MRFFSAAHSSTSTAEQVAVYSEYQSLKDSIKVRTVERNCEGERGRNVEMRIQNLVSPFFHHSLFPLTILSSGTSGSCRACHLSICIEKFQGKSMKNTFILMEHLEGQFTLADSVRDFS